MPRSPGRARAPALMLRACIDIGSNTTRLLVADCRERAPRPVLQDGAFTALGHTPGGSIPAGKLAEVADVVARQVAVARRLGARDVRAVATAAVRDAPNRDALVAAVRAAAGVEVEVLTGAQEARLAFAGAAATLGLAGGAELGVIDVGGGSCQLIVGTAPATVRWWRSLPMGSGWLVAGHLTADPPSAEDLIAARAVIARAFAGVRPPCPGRAVVVGGGTASLRTIVGPLLDAGALARALATLTDGPSAGVAARHGLAVERARLLPAALLILERAAGALGCSPAVGGGGLREGVLLARG